MLRSNLATAFAYISVFDSVTAVQISGDYCVNSGGQLGTDLEQTLG
jgi:hypothetical protein